MYPSSKVINCLSYFQELIYHQLNNLFSVCAFPLKAAIHSQNMSTLEDTMIDCSLGYGLKYSFQIP